MKPLIILLRSETAEKIPKSISRRASVLEVTTAKPLSAKPVVGCFDYLLLTSAKTWSFLKNKPDAKCIVCIGRETKASLPGRLRRSALLCSKSDREGVVRFFRSRPRGRIFFPRSALADSFLPKALRRLEFQVRVSKVYTVESCLKKRDWKQVVAKPLSEGRAINVGVTSPSSFKSLLKVSSLKDLRSKQIMFIGIGPTTTAFLKKYKVRVRQAQKTSLEGILATAIQS